MAESLREDTFLEKSLLIITLEAVSILGFKTILSFLLSPKVDKVIALENTFLEIEEAEILRSRNTSWKVFCNAMSLKFPFWMYLFASSRTSFREQVK